MPAWCKKSCADRESNPGQMLGRHLCYHYTIGAAQKWPSLWLVNDPMTIDSSCLWLCQSLCASHNRTRGPTMATLDFTTKPLAQKKNWREQISNGLPVGENTKLILLWLSNGLSQESKSSATPKGLPCSASPNFRSLVVCNSPDSWKFAFLRYFARVVCTVRLFRVLRFALLPSFMCEQI